MFMYDIVRILHTYGDRYHCCCILLLILLAASIGHFIIGREATSETYK